MATIFFPEALNQGHAMLAQSLRGEIIILSACLFMGCFGYALTLVVLGLTAAFARHIPFRVMHKASMLVGIGVAAIAELYLVPFFFFRASDQTAIIGIALGLAALAVAVGAAIRLVWRTTFYRQSQQT